MTLARHGPHLGAQPLKPTSDAGLWACAGTPGWCCLLWGARQHPLPSSPSVLPALWVHAPSGAPGESPKTKAQQLSYQGGCSKGPKAGLAVGAQEPLSPGGGRAGSRKEPSWRRRVVGMPAGLVMSMELRPGHRAGGRGGVKRRMWAWELLPLHKAATRRVRTSVSGTSLRAGGH